MIRAGLPRSDQQQSGQVHIDVVHTKMQQAGDAGKNQRVNNVGAHHHLGLEAEKQQKHHHDDAAGADRSDAYQKPRHQTDQRDAGERLHGGRTVCHAIFNSFLEEEKGGNADQQNSDRNGDEVVDSVAVDISQMNQKTHARVGTGGASDGQGKHHLAAHRSFAQMNDAGADLGDEVEEGIGADGANRGHAQSEDKNREQQDAAPDSCHSDEGSNEETDQALDQQVHLSANP